MFNLTHTKLECSTLNIKHQHQQQLMLNITPRSNFTHDTPNVKVDQTSTSNIMSITNIKICPKWKSPPEAAFQWRKDLPLQAGSNIKSMWTAPKFQVEPTSMFNFEHQTSTSTMVDVRHNTKIKLNTWQLQCSTLNIEHEHQQWLMLDITPRSNFNVQLWTSNININNSWCWT